MYSYDIECGYEAGCLGYSLYNKLTAAGEKHIILYIYTDRDFASIIHNA